MRPFDDYSIEQLRARMEQLDEWARAEEMGSAGLDELREVVFPDGPNPEDDWNDYHAVRNEHDRRAAEEFDLGQ